MGFAHLDRFAGRPSWLGRRTTPAQRVWIALAAAFAAGLMPSGAWLALGLLAVLAALGSRATAVPARTVAVRVAHASPFFLLPALALPFTLPGPIVLEIGGFSATEPGVLRAAEIIARAGVALAAVTVVLSSTRAVELLNALDELPLPSVVTGSLALAYRYLYLLTDERERMERALESRGGGARGLRLWRARALALAHLLTRAQARATRTHAAMLARGYRDQLPTLRSTAPPRPLTAAAILTAIGGIWLLGLLEVAT